jgi:hypothetical protein
MRYGSLIASAAVLLGVAACKGNDAGMNDDLAKDLAAAKTSDALALAPHAGIQTVVSAQELSPQGRASVARSSKSSRPVARRVPRRDRVAAPSAEVAAVSAPAPEPVEATPSAPSAAEPTSVIVATRPQPVDVSYPAGGSTTTRRDGGDMGSVIGGVIGAIGGVVLRGGVVDGDHCDPRGRRSGGGSILINRRGPILRGTF